MAMGGELKSSFCWLQNGTAHLSPSRGDLEQVSELRGYRQEIDELLQREGMQPEAIAVDMHPDYMSTQYGLQIAARRQIESVAVQHHHAHIAACMAEHGMEVNSKILGIALDGLGFGSDGGLWGGEFLLASYAAFDRLGHFAAIPMPGGAQATREPWRNSLAHLHACGWENISTEFADTEIVQFLCNKPLPTLFTMLEKGLNSPPASSAGRLFDAAAGMLGIHRERMEFEAQAAIMLEKMATSVWQQQPGSYPFDLVPSEHGIAIDWQPLWRALLADLQQQRTPACIAARFHHGVIDAVTALTLKLCHEHRLNTVAISGGVFQNRLLRDGVTICLRERGLRVLVPQRVPPHDGGLAFGQAVVAATRSG